MNTQRLLPFPPLKETQAERCQRLLSGVPKIKRASHLTFDEAAQREAERLVRAAADESIGTS